MKKTLVLIFTLFIMMTNVSLSQEFKLYSGIKNNQSIIYEKQDNFKNLHDNLTIGIIAEKLYVSEKVFLSGGIGGSNYQTYEIIEIDGQDVNKNVSENDVVFSIGGGYNINETTNIYIDHIMSDGFDNQTRFGIQINF